MRRKEKARKKKSGGYVAYVVVGGFKISCGEWARLGLMSHTQRRPSKEKNHHRLFYSRIYCELFRYYPIGIDPMALAREHRGKWARNRDEQMASPTVLYFRSLRVSNSLKYWLNSDIIYFIHLLCTVLCAGVPPAAPALHQIA